MRCVCLTVLCATICSVNCIWPYSGIAIQSSACCWGAENGSQTDNVIVDSPTTTMESLGQLARMEAVTPGIIPGVPVWVELKTRTNGDFTKAAKRFEWRYVTHLGEEIIERVHVACKFAQLNDDPVYRSPDKVISPSDSRRKFLAVPAPLRSDIAKIQLYYWLTEKDFVTCDFDMATESVLSGFVGDKPECVLTLREFQNILYYGQRKDIDPEHLPQGEWQLAKHLTVAEMERWRHAFNVCDPYAMLLGLRRTACLQEDGIAAVYAHSEQPISASVYLYIAAKFPAAMRDFAFFQFRDLLFQWAFYYNLENLVNDSHETLKIHRQQADTFQRKYSFSFGHMFHFFEKEESPVARLICKTVHARRVRAKGVARLGKMRYTVVLRGLRK